MKLLRSETYFSFQGPAGETDDIILSLTHLLTGASATFTSHMEFKWEEYLCGLDAQLKDGREGAGSEDTKFLSQEGEWFLAGVLDGLPDGRLSRTQPLHIYSIILVMPMVCVFHVSSPSDT